MSFQPLVPLGGFAGWKFLNRTLDDQKAAFNRDPVLDRETEKFKAQIGSIRTADELIENYEVLKVALGAFGLQDDISNKYFIKKVLEDGTSDRTALANKLSDPRYRQFSEAFGFGQGQIPGRLKPGFADEIASQYKERQFENQVGAQNNDMRLALNLRRELEKIASEDRTDDSRWFGVMGQTPLRNVFETAFGLPSSFGSLDIDQQLSTFRQRSESLFGASEISHFADPENTEDLLRHFFARSSASSGVGLTSGASIALTLLQSA